MQPSPSPSSLCGVPGGREVPGGAGLISTTRAHRDFAAAGGPSAAAGSLGAVITAALHRSRVCGPTAALGHVCARAATQHTHSPTLTPSQPLLCQPCSSARTRVCKPKHHCVHLHACGFPAPPPAGPSAHTCPRAAPGVQHVGPVPPAGAHACAPPGAMLRAWHASWQCAGVGRGICTPGPCTQLGAGTRRSKGGSGGELEARVQAIAAASLRLCRWGGRHLGVPASSQHGHPPPGRLRSPMGVGRFSIFLGSVISLCL